MKIITIVLICLLIISYGSTKLSVNKSAILFSSLCDNDLFYE